jgi:hypothetical protein
MKEMNDEYEEDEESEWEDAEMEEDELESSELMSKKSSNKLLPSSDGEDDSPVKLTIKLLRKGWRKRSACWRRMQWEPSTGRWGERWRLLSGQRTPC